MEGISVAYSEDRRYDDVSVTDTVNFDAETVNYGADSVNFDAETVDFDAPVFEPPLHHDFEEDEEELIQLNRRCGTFKYAAICFFGLVAACALAVSLTFYFERAEDKTVSAAANNVDAAANNVDAAANVGVPSLQPSMFRAGVDECFINGMCSEEGSTCAIGTETCCGETFDSVECVCTGGEWLCRATDACNRPDCGDLNTSSAPTPSPSSFDVIQTESPTTTIQTPQAEPTTVPSMKPSISPTPLPTKQPSQSPTPNPSWAPVYPTYQPTTNTSTLSPSNKPSPTPSPEPTQLPSKKPTLRPSSKPTSSPSPFPSSSRPTSTPSTSPSFQSSDKPSYSPSNKSTFGPSMQPSNVRKYCVNIKFTTDNYPRDNGFTFLSKETGQVIYEQKTGSMKQPQTEYFHQFCDLSAGSYTLVVTDTGGDGMIIRGDGSYVVDIDGRVVLVGGRMVGLNEITHEIDVGFNSIMNEADQGFLDAHNSRRMKFHESQDVSFRPMAWSAELAAGASAWAKEKAKTCNNDEKEKGKYGQNASAQRLNSLDEALNPDEIIASWMKNFDPEQPWNNNQFAGGAILWRSALYVGCATEVSRIEDRDEYCQVTNCRYVRTTNCGVKKDNWVASVIDDNGSLCNTVFCPGADENGNIVEGACHV
jgi:hypothetical protein